MIGPAGHRDRLEAPQAVLPNRPGEKTCLGITPNEPNWDLIHIHERGWALREAKSSRVTGHGGAVVVSLGRTYGRKLENLAILTLT